MNQQQFTLQIATCDKLLYSICWKYCFDQQEHADLIQEILKEAWISYPSYEYRAPFYQWLYSIGRNVAIDRLRGLKRTIKTVSLHNIFYDIEDTPPEAPVVIPSAYLSLTPARRRLLDMYAQGVGYQEMSRITGQSVNTLRVRIHEIKTALRRRQ